MTDKFIYEKESFKFGSSVFHIGVESNGVIIAIQQNEDESRTRWYVVNDPASIGKHIIKRYTTYDKDDYLVEEKSGRYDYQEGRVYEIPHMGSPSDSISRRDFDYEHSDILNAIPDFLAQAPFKVKEKVRNAGSEKGKNPLGI